MKIQQWILPLCFACALIAAGCTQPQKEVIELKKIPMDSLERMVTESGVPFDREISRDGRGSLKIIASVCGSHINQD